MANSSSPTAAQQLQNSPLGQQSPSDPLDLPVRPQVPFAIPGFASPKPLSSEDQVSAPAVDTSNLAATESAIRPNALSDLASYTYNIDLYLTNIAGHQRYAIEEKFYPQDWYKVVSSVGGLGGARPGTAIDSTISSAVQKSNDAASQYFTREYYIDNLEIETTNGLTPSDSNISFTLIEPYGINFIQELWNFSTKVLKVPNYTELCVLLVISWKGFTETGEFVELDYHKYIPVKIANIDVKVTSTGAQYSVTAVGYNDLSKDKAYGIANSGFELEGATLRDLIGDYQDTTAAKVTTPEPANHKTNLTAILNNQPRAAEQEDSTVKSGIFPTRYQFKFVDLYNTGIDIGNFKMANPEDIPSKDFPMSTPDSTTNLNVQMLQQMTKYQLLDSVRKPDDIKLNNTKVNFNKGGQILELLNRLICNSTYITDQLKTYRTKIVAAASITDPAERGKAIQALNEPLNWFRIMTKVVPTGNYDEKNNIEQKTITYSIVPVLVYDTRGAGGSLAPKETPPDNLVVKEFNYIFTGKNTEILNVDINLNLSFFTYKPSNTNTADQGSGAVPSDDPTTSSTQSGNPRETASTTNTALSALNKKQPIPNGSGAGSGVGGATTDRLYARAVSDTLFASQDMINLDLDILGDPDFIKQDGIFYQNTTADIKINNLGIATESTERFIRFTFKSPADINTETGFPDGLDDTGSTNTSESSTHTVMFNGLYCVIGVVSHFKDGKFTQTVKMRRSITESASRTAVATDKSSPAKPAIPNAASHG